MAVSQFLGIQAHSSLDEKIVASVGAVLSISAVFFLTDWLTNYTLAMTLLPSMGASAVLLLAVPHGTLSQPWPLFGGNVLSAGAGVICALSISNIYIAAGCAVGFAILIMHVFRCIHPPGGATALIAVVGGDAVRDLGFDFLLFPTLINCGVIFIFAFIFNNLFRWRRYPSSLMKYDNNMYSPETANIHVRHIQLAIESLDEIIDIAPEQIKYIIDKADELMRTETQSNFTIVIGGLYTNGAAGQAWSVRRVIDISNHSNPAKKMIMYKTVDGAGKGKNGSGLLYEFKDWAKEVMKPVKKGPAPQDKYLSGPPR